MNEKKFIDTAGIIKSRNPGLYRLLPRFILRLIKQVLHEDELNEFLDDHSNDQPAEFVDAALNRLGVRSKIISHEYAYPRRCIYAANHPLGGPDGLMLMQHLNRHGIEFKSLSNDLLNHLKPLRPWMIKVNSFGRQSRQFTAEVEKAVGADQSLLIFPSGYVSRPYEDGIRDLAWKKTFIQLSKRLHMDIVPVSISGITSNRFLRLARWRKRLGLKANIEMFLLADEMFRLKNKEITIYFHQPIAWQRLTDGQHPIEWARNIEQMIYERHPKLIYGTHEH
jgi:1-acyl-sn-glycerol-3-phosphate acyltransferase